MLSVKTTSGTVIMWVVTSNDDERGAGVLFETIQRKPLAFLVTTYCEQRIFHLYHADKECIVTFKSDEKSRSVRVMEQKKVIALCYVDMMGNVASVQGPTGALLATMTLHQRAPRQSLYLGMPKKLNSFDGEYKLMNTKFNNQPAWKHNINNTFMYSGIDGHWYIAGTHAADHGFKCSMGVGRSKTEHRGVFPGNYEGAWERHDAGKKGEGLWIEDASIFIATSSYTAAKQALDHQQAGAVFDSRFYMPE